MNVTSRVLLIGSLLLVVSLTYCMSVLDQDDIQQLLADTEQYMQSLPVAVAISRKKMAYDKRYQLICATFEGNAKAVKLLLDQGVRPDLTDSGSNSMLAIAAEKGHEHIVQELLRHPRMKINHANALGETPIFLATCNGHEDIVRQLIVYGADIDQETHYGWTPLFAAQQSELKNMEYLLKAMMQFNMDRL